MTRYSKDVQRLLNRRGILNARDGAVIDPVVDDANGIQWFFQFRKNSLSKYKWIAMGQQEPLVGFSGAGLVATPINTYVVSAAAVLIPFSGEYVPQIYGQFGTTAVSTLTYGYSLDGTTTAVMSLSETMNTGYNDYIEAEDQIVREFQAQHALTPILQASVLGVTANSQAIKLRPRRVSI